MYAHKDVGERNGMVSKLKYIKYMTICYDI